MCTTRMDYECWYFRIERWESIGLPRLDLDLQGLPRLDEVVLFV